MKQITHEEARRLCVWEYNAGKMLEYITQQEKKEKLLELYQEYLEMCQRGECDWNHRRNDIPLQIKTLEEEMK
jgi:hypothetical protein